MYHGPLFITSDHAGYQLKKRLVRFLDKELGIIATDLGPAEHDPEDDFPDYVIPAAQKAVAADGRAIMICGSGIGTSIAANKVPGMYAALAYNIESAELSRKHNNANGLCLAGRVLSEAHAMAMVKKWLETEFAGGKYDRRNKKIQAVESH
jgi:RpiB/LacA/LacB family sugar-phosphate isomerase